MIQMIKIRHAQALWGGGRGAQKLINFLIMGGCINHPLGLTKRRAHQPGGCRKNGSFPSLFCDGTSRFAPAPKDPDLLRVHDLKALPL